MNATFWGGVEVAWSSLLKVIAILPKVVRFAPLLFSVTGTTPLGLSLLFPVFMFTHSEDTENIGRSDKLRSLGAFD